MKPKTDAEDLCFDWLEIIHSAYVNGGLGVATVPVPPEHPGQVPLGKPHGDGTHEHPQDGQLIQHLTKEAEGGMKVR